MHGSCTSWMQEYCGASDWYVSVLAMCLLAPFLKGVLNQAMWVLHHVVHRDTRISSICGIGFASSMLCMLRNAMQVQKKHQKKVLRVL